MVDTSDKLIAAWIVVWLRRLFLNLKAKLFNQYDVLHLKYKNYGPSNTTNITMRILILDGAMGTMIQRYKLTEEQFKGERFEGTNKLQKGNNDLLPSLSPILLSKFIESTLKLALILLKQTPSILTPYPCKIMACKML